MGLILEFDIGQLTARLRAAAALTKGLPSDPSKNPVALAIIDYQFKLANSERPTIGSDGTVMGDAWPAHGPAYIRQDGTVVPRWGGVTRAHGRGKVLGQLKSEGVGKGSGSRYRRDDRQLGARAGGLWMDWVTQKPVLVGGGNFIAVLSSPFKYAKRQFHRRSVTGTGAIAFLNARLKVRAEEYLNDLADFIERRSR